MSEEKSEMVASKWFSTYGLITVERLLGTYQIKLAQTDLLSVMENSFNFYHKLLTIPLKLVLNGIVLQQAKDYHIYAQKLFIDYLISGENSKGEEAQGSSTHEAMENERKQLVLLGEEYHKHELEHNNLIANSQKILIQISHEFNEAMKQALTRLMATLDKNGLSIDKKSLFKAINHALISCDLSDPQLQSKQFLFTEKMNDLLKMQLTEDLKEKIMADLVPVFELVNNLEATTRPFIEDADEVTVEANSFRSQFHDTIIRVMELIQLLPEYKLDLEQDAMNREPLHFDISIGALTK